MILSSFKLLALVDMKVTKEEVTKKVKNVIFTYECNVLYDIRE